MAEMKERVIKRGKTFSLIVRWENADLIVRKPITAISLAFGAPRLTVAGHGAPAGWRAAVNRVNGMKQINSASIPPNEDDYHAVTVIDSNTIEFNEIDPVDDNGKEWPAYADGGFLQYNAPVDLAGYTARLSICDRPAKKGEKTARRWHASTAYAAGQYIVLADLETVLVCSVAGTSGSVQPTSPGVDGSVTWAAATAFSGPKEYWRMTDADGIAIDNANKTTTITVEASESESFSWTVGVWELEMVSPTNKVTRTLFERVRISEEVTT